MSAPSSSTRSLRADARRNRARVLAAARELFAVEGLDVPLDAIARRASVGAGTVHRHFPTKDVLIMEILVIDLSARVAEARARPADTEPGAALFWLLEALLDDGLTNRAMKSALAQSGTDFTGAARGALDELDQLLDDLLWGAQRAGAVRRDVDVDDIKAVLAGAMAAQAQRAVNFRRAMHVRSLVLESLRPAALPRGS